MADSRSLTIHAAHDLRIEEMPAQHPGPGEVLIAIGRGGICGSDLHYYQHGGFGAVRLQQPMILGHEVAGTITALGEGVTGLRVGDAVAISPSRPCGSCSYCAENLPNHCIDMRFYGSAMPMPHIQGAFRQKLVALASQCHLLDEGTTLEQGAFAEPFAVALHAMARAGNVRGKRVLITGCGPIGALAILAARVKGASEITVTDVAPAALDMARALGADNTVDARDPDALSGRAQGKGSIDVMVECSGNGAALAAGLATIRPRGVLVQVGLGGEVAVPLNLLASREVDLRGSFRFHHEFGEAVALINAGTVDVMPLLTRIFPFEQADEAFALAADRSKAMKVQLAFDS